MIRKLKSGLYRLYSRIDQSEDGQALQPWDISDAR